MKNKITKLCIGILAIIGAVSIVKIATAQIPLFGGVPVYGTSNGPVVATFTPTITVRPIYTALSGMTNAASVFIGNVQLSLDQTNYVTIGSFTNSGSNAFSTNMASFQSTVPVYLRMQAKTDTNTIIVAATYGP